MGWQNHMNWGWGGTIMMLFWILLFAAVIYWLMKSAQKNTNQPSMPDSAMEILKKRYARGEISKQEFEERKKDIS